jgi:tol-pal system protein YbgF
VEYAGDAAKTSAKRPLLRLYGDDASVLPVEPARAERTPTAADEREGKRMAVVPAESRREARAVEQPRVAAGGAVDVYRRSLEALRGGRHVEAAAGFREFLKHHPNHDFADNAQYWLGECYYDQKDYPMAMREFRRVVEKYAHGNKVADALLKVGFSHVALGSAEVGRQVLEQVVRSYPQHEAAGLASAKLRELGAAASASPAGSRSPEEKP